jgi:hypothetical protein
MRGYADTATISDGKREVRLFTECGLAWTCQLMDWPRQIWTRHWSLAFIRLVSGERFRGDLL